MKTLWSGLLALFALAAASCSAPALDADAIVADRNSAFVDAFASGDAGAVAAMYHESAVVMPDGADAVQGRDAIAQFWQGFIDSGAARVALTTDETAQAGATTILERGSFQVFDGTGAVLGEGKYVVVWTLAGRDWLLSWDIWNANAESAPAGE